MKKYWLMLTLAATVGIFPAPAQTTVSFDTSGNGLLNGTYNFRHVAYYASDAQGDLGQQQALFGSIVFDGKGNYTLTGQLVDTMVTPVQARSFSTTGTYQMAASGFGTIDSPLVAGESISGLAAQGVFTGSDTEAAAVNDFFVAVQAGSTPATNASFNGSYWIANMNIPTSGVAQASDALFQLSTNGSGGVAAISATGYIGTSGNLITQAISNATYSFSNGTGTLAFGAGGSAASTLISGNETFYVSSDGNFLVGGSNSGFDITVGVKALSGTTGSQAYNGLFYYGGVTEDLSDIPDFGAGLATFYGSLNAVGSIPAIGLNETIIHQRVTPFSSGAFDLTEDNPYTFNRDGTLSDFFGTSAIGAGGNGIVGAGNGPVLGISLELRAPSFSGPGVYINPTGVINAASFAPFTAGLSPGEFLSIFGTNLSSTTLLASSVPLPNILGGVQVMINGIAAPIYSVSPTQLNVIVPFELSSQSVAGVQVINNGTSSNTVTEYVNGTSPGVFTTSANGLGFADVFHSNFTVVSASNPAKAGETVIAYVTGLGSVTPSVANGAAGPSSPLSNASSQPQVFFNDLNNETQGNVTYAGLAPGFPGIYQINVQVPTGLQSGLVYFEIGGADGSFNSQAIINVQ